MMRVNDFNTQIGLPALRPAQPAHRPAKPENHPEKTMTRNLYSVSSESYGSARQTILAVKGRFVNTVV